MSAGMVAEIWAVAASAKSGETEKIGAGKREEEGGEWSWICDLQRAGGVGGALFHGAGAVDRTGGAEAVWGFIAIRCRHRAQGAAGAGAGEVDDLHPGADVHLQHGGARGKTVQAGDAGFLRGVPGAGELLVHPAI